MPTRRFLFLFLFALSLPSSARADEAPPLENIVCGSNKAGEACEVNGAAGTCVADTCSRLDYSQGVPPKSVVRDCMRCQVGAPPATQPPAPAAPAPVAPAPAAPAPAAPAATTSGCQVAPGTTTAPFLLLLFAPLLGRRARRAPSSRR